MKHLFLCDGLQPERVAPACRDRGLGIEIQSFYDPELAFHGPDAVERQRSLVEGVERRSLHGPFADLCPGSFDPMVRDLARSRFELAFGIARQLDAKHVILHHGYVPGTTPPKNWLKRIKPFFESFLADKPSEVHFCLENMVEHGPELLSDVLDAVDSPNLHACLDIGHAHCYSRVSAVQWVRKLGKRIRYVHLHDNDGQGDQHLGFGEGNLPLVDVLEELESRAPDAIWAVEARPESIAESLNWLEANGFANPSSQTNG